MVSYSVPPDDVVFKQSLVRTAAVTLMAYDFLRTLPAEWRFAARTKASGTRWNRAYLLYMSVRYITVIDISLSTIGFFSGGLGDPNKCYPFIFAVRYLRCVTASCASAILSWRAWAICQRSRQLGWLLVGLFTAVAAIQIWSQSYSSLRIGPLGQCFASNPKPDYAVAFYACNLLFDMFLAVIATRQLWINSNQSGMVQPFTATLIKEGLIYYVVCSAANVVNLVLWSQSPKTGIQSVGSNLGIVMTSIMAQMLMLSLQEITVIRDNTTEEHRPRPRKLGGNLGSKLSNVFGGAGGNGHNTSASRDGELSVKVHVDVLHTFDESEGRDKERQMRPSVRSQSDADHEVESEKDSTTMRDLELGPVSPRGPRDPRVAHMRNYS